jgi:hypothetical protein
MNLTPSQSDAIHMIEAIGLLGVTISSAEWLAKPEQIRNSGIFSWDVCRLRARWMVEGRIATCLSVVFENPGLTVLLLLRPAIALAIALGLANGWEHAALLTLVAVVTVLIRVRFPMGLDGSDQMAGIVFVTLSLVYWIGTPRAAQLCLVFLAAQCCLSYQAAGWLKLKERGWRNGTYLARVLSSGAYGHAAAGQYLTGHMALSRMLSWSVIALETSFPILFVLPRFAAVGFLAAGLSFHVGTGLLMGLNTFVFFFGAAYPAIAYCVGVS